MLLIACALGVLIGNIGGLYAKEQIILFFVYFLILAIFFFVQVCIQEKEKKLLLVKLGRIFIAIFVLSSMYSMHLKERQEKLYRGVEEAEIVGTIISEVEEKEYYDIAIVKVEKVNGQVKFRNTKLQIKIKKKVKRNIQYGDRISFLGTIEMAQQQRNEGGYNEQENFHAKGIYAKAIIDGEIEVLETNKVFFLQGIAYKVREKMKNGFKQLFSQEETGILLGMLVGNKSEISREILANFQDSNLSHILAVSGMHVQYMIMGILSLHSHHKNRGRWIIIGFLFFFMFLANFTPSIVRACITGILSVTGMLLHRKSNVWSHLSFSILIIFLGNPFCFLDLGFLFSYGGTIGILLFAGKMQTKINSFQKIPKFFKKILTIFAVSFSAQLIIFPIAWWKLGTVSFSFLLSNLVVSPLLGILLIGGFFVFFISLFSIFLAKIPAFFLGYVLKLFLYLVSQTAKIPGGKIYLPIPNILCFATYYIFLFFIMKRKKLKMNRRKYIFGGSILSVIIGVIIILSIFFPKDLQVYFVDVGQGDSTFITTTTGKKILIDGGGNRNPENFDVGKSVVLPFLLKKGVASIDYIFISHFDADHCRTVY